MIADIFYPIFTLTITVLAYFAQKNKVVRGFHTYDFIKASPWTLWGAVTPPDLQLQSTDAPIFFLFYPLCHLKYISVSHCFKSPLLNSKPPSELEVSKTLRIDS